MGYVPFDRLYHQIVVMGAPPLIPVWYWSYRNLRGGQGMYPDVDLVEFDEGPTGTETPRRTAEAELDRLLKALEEERLQGKEDGKDPTS